MVGWFEYVNMIWRWNGAMIFVFFSKWWNGPMANINKLGTNGEMVKSWYGRMIWICQYYLVVKWCNDFCIFFQTMKWSNGEYGKIGQKWWNGEIMIWWKGDMLLWFEYLNMILWWNGAMIFVLFSKWWNGPMANTFFSGHIFIGGDMVKWRRKNINGKMNHW